MSEAATIQSQKGTDVDAEKAEGIVIKRLKAERNLLRFPFFALSNRDASRRRKSEINIRYAVDGTSYQGKVKILAAEDYIYPTPFDGKVHRTIEYLITRRGFPIENPFRFTSYEVLKELGKDPHSGFNIKQVRESIKRLTVTSIDAEQLIHDSSRKRAANGRVFHLYNDFGYYGDEGDDGKPIEKNWIELSAWLLGNLNNNYVRPLDFEYYKALSIPVAQRLYELVGFGFYGIFLNKPPEEWGESFVRYDYQNLCPQLPLTPQKYLSKAKEKLSPGHEMLKKTGFFARIKWEKADKANWAILYFPGPKAVQEFQNNRRINAEAVEQLEMPLQQPEATGVGESPENRSDRENEAPEGTSEADCHPIDLAQQLIERGIRPRAAGELAKKFHDRVGHTIEVFDFLCQQPDNQIKSKPAFLRRAVEEHWFRDTKSLPEGFTSKEERRQQEEAAHELAREYQNQKQQVIENVEALLKLAPEQRVAAMLDAWETAERKLRRAPSPEERAQRQARYIQNLPSKDKLLSDKLRDLQAEYEQKGREQGIDLDLSTSAPQQARS